MRKLNITARFNRGVLAGDAGAALLVGGATTAQAALSAQAEAKPTIVLLHGAFADGSSWIEVTRRSGAAELANHLHNDQ